MTKLSTKSNLKEFIPGVFIIPPILSSGDIEKILTLNSIKCHHDDGSDGHGDGHFSINKKPHKMTWLANLIWKHILDVDLKNFKPISVDENMKLYWLKPQTGEVHQHKDEDFKGPNGSVAKFSILMYLNDDFTGGETVFNGNVFAPHSPIGGGLLFRHDILHEGLQIISGDKLVVKTDLFVEEI